MTQQNNTISVILLMIVLVSIGCQRVKSFVDIGHGPLELRKGFKSLNFQDAQEYWGYSDNSYLFKCAIYNPNPGCFTARSLYLKKNQSSYTLLYMEYTVPGRYVVYYYPQMVFRAEKTLIIGECDAIAFKIERKFGGKVVRKGHLETFRREEDLVRIKVELDLSEAKTCSALPKDDPDFILFYDIVQKFLNEREGSEN